MTNLFILFILAVVAGASVTVQQVLNSNLRTALNSAAWSGFVSYFVGLICMAALALALRNPIPSLSEITRIPLWGFSGGLFGAIFIGLGIYLVPQLGAATFIVLLVTGQMMTSILIDHFGFFGVNKYPIDISRIAGAAFLIGGCILIRK